MVFGGSAPPISGVVTVGTGGLYLNNGGDDVVVRRPDGAILAELHYGGEGGHDQSLVRQLDADPDSPMVGHRSLSDLVASPGLQSDGGPFVFGPPFAPILVINEVLADPPAGYDANGDGVASPTADEFVELFNAGETLLDLGGATLSDATGVRATFPAGTKLGSNKALVLFGGGAPALPGVTALVLGPLSLNNGGDRLVVRGPTGLILAEMTYGPEGGMDQSLVRSLEGNVDAPFVGHRAVSDQPASPGRRSSGQPW